MTRVLLVLPARAGSVGVWNKHERPIAGVPLASRAIQTAMRAAAICKLVSSTSDEAIDAEVVVTTNHEQVWARAEMFQSYEPPVTLDDDGKDFTMPVSLHRVWRDNEALSLPGAPITDAVTHAVETLAGLGETYDIVAIHQMTAATLTAERIATSILEFVASDHDSAATMVRFHGFLWAESGPLVLDRVNRQMQDARWLETGGLQLTRGYPRSDGWYGTAAPQIGVSHHTIEVVDEEAVDIDTPEDIARAESVIRRWTTLIVTRGDQLVGSGHLHRATAIAASLDPWSDVKIVCVDTPADMRDMIPGRWLEVCSPGHALAADPDAVIVDVLDAAIGDQICATHGGRVVRFECDNDRCGARHHVNALRAGYSSDDMHSGADWFDLRWEFVGLPRPQPDLTGPIVVTFGGTDPGGWTAEVANALIGEGHSVVVVPPPAASSFAASELREGCMVVEQPHMASVIAGAAAVVTSRGRTAWEAAYMRRPVVTLAANEREAIRNEIPPFADSATTVEEVVDLIADIVADGDTYYRRCDQIGKLVDGHGLDRIVRLVAETATEKK